MTTPLEKIAEEKTRNYQSSLNGGGGVPHTGKRPIYFRFFLLKASLRSYLQSLVKIESVRAEIFLIWTNVTKTNVAWTNVTVTVGNWIRLVYWVSVQNFSILACLEIPEKFVVVVVVGGGAGGVKIVSRQSLEFSFSQVEQNLQGYCDNCCIISCNTCNILITCLNTFFVIIIIILIIFIQYLQSHVTGHEYEYTTTCLF